MRHRINPGPRRKASLLAGTLMPAMLVLLPQAAWADVFEITAGGTMRARSGAGAVHWAGVDVAAAQPKDGPEPQFATQSVAVAQESAEMAELGSLPGSLAGQAVTSLAGQAVTIAGGSLSPMAWRATVDQAARRARISPALLEALVWQESRWHPGAVSRAGAVGLGQLMPATARNMGVNPRDPVANLHACARYLRAMLDRFDGNVEWALAAYNAGPERVARAGGIPAIAETRAYVRAVMGRLNATLAGVP